MYVVSSGYLGANTSALLKTDDGGASWAPVVRPTGDLAFFHFFSPTTGFIALENGCRPSDPTCTGDIFSTTDGGSKWRSAFSLSGPAWQGGTYRGPGAAWLTAGAPECAQSGPPCPAQLFATTNQGQSWQEIPSSSPPPDLGTIGFTSPVAGVGVDLWGQFYVTKDGGSTWTPTTHLANVSGEGTVEVSGGDLFYHFCNILDDANGGCMNYVYRSRNGGLTWKAVWSQYCLRNTWLSMDGASSGVMVTGGLTACGAGNSNAVLVTRDGWQHVTKETPLPINVTSAFFLGPSTLWAAGNSVTCDTSPAGPSGECPAIVMESQDDGKDWEVLSPPTVPASTIATPGTGSGFYGVGSVAHPNAVLFSLNGKMWTEVGRLPWNPGVQHPWVPGSPAGLPAGLLSFPTPKVGYAIAAGSLLAKTEDGGHSLRPLAPPEPGDGLWDVAFPTSQVGYLLVGPPTCASTVQCPPEIWQTADGGQRWSLRHTFPATSEIASIAFVSQAVGFADPWGCGPTSRPHCSPTLLETKDGGVHWTPVGQPPQGFGGASVRFSGGRLLLVAPNGVAISPDLGQTFQVFTSVDLGPGSAQGILAAADERGRLFILTGDSLYREVSGAPWTPVP